MYKASKDQPVNQEQEIQAVKNYVNTFWTKGTQSNPKAIEELLEKVWNATLSTNPYWLSPYIAPQAFMTLMKERLSLGNWKKHNPDISEVEVGCAMELDAIALFAMDGMRLRSLGEYGAKNWDYEKTVNRLVREFKKENPDYKSLMPIGYNYSQKNFSVKPTHIKPNNFTGIDSQCAVAPGFSERISPNNIVYDHAEQRRDPLTTLVGALAAHALFVVEHNNTLVFNQAVDTVVEKLSAPQYYDKLYHTIDIETLTTHSLLIAWHKANLATRSQTLTEAEFEEKKQIYMLQLIPEKALSPQDKKRLQDYEEKNETVPRSNPKKENMSRLIEKFLNPLEPPALNKVGKAKP